MVDSSQFFFLSGNAERGDVLGSVRAVNVLEFLRNTQRGDALPVSTESLILNA